jgi:hypothetical protein
MKLDKILEYAPINQSNLQFIVGLDEVGFSSANAICLDCGSTKQEISLLNAGLCINGHDNWLELEDNAERYQLAIEKFGCDFKIINNVIKTNTDL